MEKVRISLLAVILGGVVLVLGKEIFSPVASSSKVVQQPLPLVFPATVGLQDWQETSSRSLTESVSKPAATADDSRIRSLSGREYKYVRNNLPLDIRMLYVINTRGKFGPKSIIQYYSPVKLAFNSPSVDVRHQQGIGFYSVFAYQQRAYLSACINPRGGSTVSQLQFMLNRYIHDLRWSRILPWLLGQGPLTDRRCLWAHLSIPLENSAPEEAYQSLETVWFSWYRWWQPRFPKS